MIGADFSWYRWACLRYISRAALSCLVALAHGNAPAHAAPELSCAGPEGLSASASAFRLTRLDLAGLSDPSLCVGFRSVTNGTLVWQLLVVRHRSDPERLLWYAPHTNEELAFQNGIVAVVHHHGTLLAVRTVDGGRCLKRQDPNRVFGTLQGGGDSCAGGGVHCVPLVSDTMPPFTAEVMSWHAAGSPIVGLHTNQKGYDSSAHCLHPTGGGNITAACSRGILTVLRPRQPARGASPDDTMVYVSGTGSRENTFKADPGLASVVEDLRKLRTNIIFEHVGRSDCLLSNYAVLHGLPHYFNVEVETSDGAEQALIVDDLVASLQRNLLVAEPKERAR